MFAICVISVGEVAAVFSAFFTFAGLLVAIADYKRKK